MNTSWDIPFLACLSRLEPSSKQPRHSWPHLHSLLPFFIHTASIYAPVIMLPPPPFCGCFSSSQLSYKAFPWPPIISHPKLSLSSLRFIPVTHPWLFYRPPPRMRTMFPSWSVLKKVHITHRTGVKLPLKIQRGHQCFYSCPNALRRGRYFPPLMKYNKHWVIKDERSKRERLTLVMILPDPSSRSACTKRKRKRKKGSRKQLRNVLGIFGKEVSEAVMEGQ